MRAQFSNWVLFLFILAFHAAAQTNPVAITLPATNVVAVEGLAEATLQGAVNPGGTNTTAWFEWGVRLNYGNSTALSNAGNGTNPIPINAILTNLNAGWRYHYRLVASNSLGVVRGVDCVCWAPAIALNGANPLTNECHTRYMEPARVKATPVAIAAGLYYSLALRSDGTAIGWGEYEGDTGFRSAIPTAATNLVGIASCRTHSLAVRADGRVFGWGTNLGQLNIPNNLTNVIAVAVAPTSDFFITSGYGLALKSDGKVVGWGSFNSTNMTNAFAGATNVVAIAASYNHCLALKSDGTVIVGASPSQTNVPTGATNIIAIAAGASHSLALRADGLVIGWGDNSKGQTNVPANATNLVVIAAGQYHNLAICADGSVIGWGDNSSGQINIPANVTNAVAIAAGYGYSLAVLATGNVIGWGDNSLGQAKSPDDVVAVSVAAGTQHALALKPDGTVISWGSKSINGIFSLKVPVGLSNVVAIAAGFGHSLALKKDGAIVGWGYSNLGQINTPAGVTNVTAIAASLFQSFALKADKTAIGWGQASFTSTNSNIKAIAQGGSQRFWINDDGTTGGGAPFASNAVAVAAGFGHGLTLDASGYVYASGGNSDGQAVVPAGMTNAVAIAAGGNFPHGFSLAVRNDGSVVGWGTTNNGEIFIPARAKDVVALAASVHSQAYPTNSLCYSLALRANGSVIGWGINDSGQLNIPGSPSTLEIDVCVTGSVNTNVPGSYGLTYSVTNAGAISTATRTVVVADTTPPRITLLGKNPLMLEVGSPFFDAGATALDLCGGDLTGGLVSSNNVNVNVPGTYAVNYSVTDGSGFTSGTNRTVLVITRPSLFVPTQSGDGSFQFSFSNTPGAQFNVLTSTNVSSPLDQWTVLGAAMEGPAGTFQFVDAGATNRSTSFYQLRSP